MIQLVIEKLYNDQLYHDPRNLTNRLMAMAEREWARFDKKGEIDYDEISDTRGSLLKICRDGVKGYVQTMKAHRLLGPWARAEVDLIGWVDKWTAVGGRADVIIRREDTGITILDGKNTRHKMERADPDQLRWYALMFYLSYGKMPDRLGFVWYRFPHGSETEQEDGTVVQETGVTWVEFTKEDLEGLALRAVEARNGMRKKKFAADPEPQKCRMCDYESECLERQAQRKANAGNRAPRTVDEISEGGGFSDFSL